MKDKKKRMLWLKLKRLAKFGWVEIDFVYTIKPDRFLKPVGFVLNVKNPNSEIISGLGFFLCL